MIIEAPRYQLTPQPDIVVREPYPGQWYAWEGDYDEGTFTGSGRTPLDAIVDLLDKLEI